MSHFADGFDESYDGDCRLVILRALQEEQSGTLNSTVLLATIRTFGYRQPVEFLITQLNWLEKTAGAVRLRNAGSVVIAELTQKGEDHLSRISPICGINKPSLPR